MIINEPFYAVECDICEEIAEDNVQGYSWWYSEERASEYATESCDYRLINDKYYCPKCIKIVQSKWLDELNALVQADKGQSVYVMEDDVIDYFTDGLTPQEALAEAYKRNEPFITYK